jgi:hypothetical protein
MLSNSPAPSGAPASVSRQAWLAVLSVGIGAFALVTTEFLPVGLLPAIAADLGITKGVAGLMVTIPGLIAAFAAIFVTVGSGRIDRRVVIWSLMGLLVVSNLLVALAPSFAVVLLGRALLGIGVGGFWAIGGALGQRPGRGRGSGAVFPAAQAAIDQPGETAPAAGAVRRAQGQAGPDRHRADFRRPVRRLHLHHAFSHPGIGHAGE